MARVLLQLGSKLARDHLRKSVVSGAKAVRDEARQNHRFINRTGRLERNIIVKWVSNKSGLFQATYYVLARSGKRFQKMAGKRLRKGMHGPVQLENNDAFYWRFLEFGTKFIQARGFMRKAFTAKREVALGLITENLRKGIDQSVRALRGGE